MTEVMSVKQYRALTKRKQSKYGNRKVKRDGLTFDSEKEYRRWGILKLLEKQGEIMNLERQVRFDLGVGFYVADFTYYKIFPAPWKYEKIVEDVKGFRTAVYKLKKKLMLSVHGITIKEV